MMFCCKSSTQSWCSAVSQQHSHDVLLYTVINTIMTCVSAPVFSILSMLFFATIRALMSKLVDRSEQGRYYKAVQVCCILRRNYSVHDVQIHRSSYVYNVNTCASKLVYMYVWRKPRNTSFYFRGGIRNDFVWRDNPASVCRIRFQRHLR